MVGQRQLGSWASIPGHLPGWAYGYIMGAGHTCPACWLLAPHSTLKLLRKLLGPLLSPGAQTSCAHEWILVHSLTDEPGLSHTLWQDGPLTPVSLRLRSGSVGD